MYADLTLVQILDDLTSRFIINVPDEELSSIQRVIFQIEQAHWFYTDFVREENHHLAQYSLKSFTLLLFKHCSLLHHWVDEHLTAFAQFMEYKVTVPVCGAIILNQDLKKALLVRGWKANSGWGFPKGKINKDESEILCAVREVFDGLNKVYEETGFDCSPHIRKGEYIERTFNEQVQRLYIIAGISEEQEFITQTRREIGDIKWHTLKSLPGFNKADPNAGLATANKNHKFYLVSPIMQQLKRWIQRFNNARIQGLARRNANLRLTVDTEATESDQFSESVYAYGNVTDEEYLMSVTDVTSLEASIKNILGMNTHDQVPPEIPLPIFPTDSLRSPSPIVRQGSEGRAKPQAKLAKEVVERPKPVKILKRDVEVSNAQSFATSMKSGSIAPNDDEKAEILKNILLGNVFAPSPSTVEPEKVVSPIAKRVQPQPQFTILKRQAKDVPQDSTDSKTTPAVKQAATKSLPKEKEPKPAQVRPTAILKRNATPEPQRTAAPALKSQQQTLFDILLGGSSKADSSVGYREPVLSPGPSFTESSPVSQSDSPQIMRSASHQSSQNSRPSIAAANTQPKRASLSEQQRSSALEDIMLGVSSSQSQNTMKPPKPPQRKGMKHGSSLESIDTQSSNATSKSVLLDLLVAKTPSASSQKAKLPEIQTTRTRSGRGISPAVSLMDILDTHPTSPSVVTMFQRQLKPSEPDQKAKLLSLLLNGS